MNKLYALLTYNINLRDSTSYYVKQCYPARHTPASKELCDRLMSNIPSDRILVFACLVCSEVVYTVFGEEIRALDPENTYTEFSKDSNRPPEDASGLMYDLTCTAEELKPVCAMLDEDIRDRLITPTWIESVGAVCLQLLRETAE